MRVVVQRVLEASVVVSNTAVAVISKGLLVLLGIAHTDTQEDIDWLVKKISQLRIFEDGLELDNVYNSQRKTEIDKFFEQIENQAKQKELKFNNLVTDGNKLFSKKEYANAILKYEEALKIKSDNVVSSQLANAKKNLELATEQKDLQNKYDEFISSGDKSVSGSDFKTALEFSSKTFANLIVDKPILFTSRIFLVAFILI